MTIQTLDGDEVSISEMTDEALIRERNFWNSKLPRSFHKSSGEYDAVARVLTEIENEINRREHEGPPWLAE